MWISREPIPMATIQAYNRVFMVSFRIDTAENVVTQTGVLTVGRMFDVHEEPGYPAIDQTYTLPKGFRTSL